MGKKKVVPVEYSGAKKLMAPFEKNVEKKEQTLSAPKKVLKEEKAKKETQSDLDKYQKTFDDISLKLGNMRNVNSKSGGRKVFSDKDISVYTARIKNVGKILAGLYEKRGELDKMYEVRSRVSNALLAQEEDAAPRSIQGISIPNSIRRETNRDLDEAHYRADADKIAKKYIDKEYSEDGNDVKDFMNRFGANYAAAKLGTKSSKGGYDYAQNPTSAREYYNDTVEKIQQQFAGRNSGIVGKGGVISKNLASYLPQLEGQIDYGVQGVVAVGGTAALTGNPKLALGAAKYGYALGSGIYSYEQMYGDSFNKFSKMTDFDTAKKMAHDEGLLSGGVEGIDTLTDIAGLGYGKLLKVLGKESVEKMAKDSIYKVLGRYAANVLGEGGQEGLQELISIANERRLEKGTTDSGVSGLVEETIALIGEVAKGENPEALKRAKESGIEGMKTATVIGAPAVAINTMATNAVIDEKSGSKKAENADDVLYQIEYDAENVPFVVVENDILEGLDTKQKEAKVKDVLKKRFQRGVQVGNNLIRVNKMTRNEVVNSKYSQTLKRNNPELYDAKLNALTETEDVLKASRNYVNEERKHARKDNVIDFARGTVNLRIGNKDYKAEIVVGTTIGNNLVLYDVVGLDTAVISDKKTKSFSRADVVAEKSRYQQSAKNSYEAQSPSGSKAEQKKTAGGASASDKSISQNSKNINKNITDFDKVIAMGDNDAAEIARNNIADVKTDGPDVLYQIEDEDGKILNTDDKSGKIEIERKSAIETKIKYSPNGLKLPAGERERLFSRISTDYYHTNKTHEGLQYQSVVTDSEHLLYVYQDGGFGHYNVLARVDYQNEFAAKRITEEIDNGRIYEISKVIDRVLESPEIRQSGYNVYNALTKKRRRTIGDASLYSRQSEGNTGRVDAGGNGDSRSGNRNVSDFDKVIAMGDNDAAEIAQKRIQDAENQDDVLNSIEHIGTTGKSGITYDDIVSGNLTEEVREQKENFEGAVGRAGFKVIYAPGRNVPKGTIGYVDFKNREIYISPEHFSESLLNHELTHVIDRGYDGKYVKSLISFFEEEMSKDWNDAEQAIRDKYKRIAEENPGFTYSERTIQAETLAEMCEKFSTDKYIKNAANMKTGTIRQIAVMFRYMWSKMLYHFGDNSEARKMKIASMKWQMALYRAVNEGKANGSGVVFSTEKSFAEQLHETLNTKIDDGNMVYVCETPMNLKKLGFNNKPMLITRGHLRDVNHEKSATESKYHGLSEDTIAMLPYIISHPAMVFDSISEKSPDSVCILSDVLDGDGNPIIVAIKPDGSGMYNNVYIGSNVVKTVYGKDGFESYLERLAEKSDNVLIINEKRTQKLLDSRGLQLPTGLSNLEFNTILHQSKNVVKKNKSTESDINFAIADDEGSAGQDSGSNVRDASALEEEIGIIDEALQDKTLDKEDRMNLIKDRIRLKRELSAIVGEKNENKPTMREKTLDEYKRTGDVGVLPDRDEIRAAESYDKKKISEYRKEFAEIQEALRNQEDLSADDVEELKMRRDAVVTGLNRVSKNNSVLSEMEGILDEYGVAEEPDHSWVSDIAEELSDNQNILTNGLYDTKDVERNFRQFFGKYFKMAYEKILKPLYESKKKWAEGVESYAKRIKDEVVSGLGIYAGSRESAAVMWLGEGKRPLSKRELVKTYGREGAKQKIAEAKKDGQSEVFIEYSFDDCKKEFGEEVARNIQKATEVFRKMYDELIAAVNKVRAELYPNNPDKLVKKRKDYFHHFQEMSKGFEGLRNILNTNIGIDPMLVGTSEHTKPKSKWQAYMQERTGNRTEYDAVGGFLDYISAAQYSIHIDPNIVNVRGLARELALAKASENGEHGNPDANVFIEYLQKYANHLAGKTVSHGDRGAISKIGRTSLAVLSWLNNMTKASAVLGNLNTVLTQFTNVLNMIGKIEHQSDAVKGVVGALAGIYRKGRVAARYNESGFLKERFLDKKTDLYKFSKWSAKKILQTPGHFASWLLGFADEVGTRITWNAGYNEAVRKGVDNPVQYADNFTRACVAGRGIGEVPLVFQSQVAKLFLPFRVEVLNNLNVQQDILFGKDDDGKSVAVGKRVKNMMQFMIWSSIANILLSAIKSDDFDPIDEAKEGAEENGFLGGVEAVLRDYADGIGDPVVFDPIYDIVTGIYQGINEGESAGGKVGRTVQRTVQNIAGDLVSNNPFSTLVIGTLGADPEDVDKLFNGRMYSPGGLGMPLAGNAARVLGELMDEDYLSAAVAIAKGFVPMGTQIDRSIKGVYDYKKGYATTEAAYERMATPLLSKLKGEPVGEGDLKYLIEPRWGNAVRSALFGPGAFSGESDAFYNDKTRKFTDKEQAEILSKSDYDSRKVTFDEILAGRVYDSEEEERKTAVAEEFFRDNEDSILYEIYSSGEDAALPYRNMGVSASFTDSKTKKKYTLKLSAEEAGKITDEMCTVIAKRFDRANESDVFSTMTREEQVKYLDGVKNAEYEFAKISALHDKGKMSDEDFFRFESNYKKTEAERDRALYVDDVSLYVEYNVADTVGQYASYTDVPISEEGYEQLRAWSEYASTREPDDVDKELMRLSNATDSSINVSGNPYGIINYEKNYVEYKISMPDNKIYALCDEVDKAVRSGLSKLFATTAYLNASAEVQKDMVASVKSKVRADIKDKYKVKYKSVKIDDFDKVINMGK